jgi:hypothetical protein
MSQLSFQIPNSLSNPTTLPADMQRSLTQLRQQNNRAPGVVRQPVRIGGKVSRGNKRGDMGSRPTERGVAVRVYADRGSSREVEIPEDAANYIGVQSGSGAPTTDNFAENQYGWFYDSAGSDMYFVVNFGGTITNITAPEATTSAVGLMAATDKALLATATTTPTASAIVLYDSNSEINAVRFNATTSLRVGGDRVVSTRQAAIADAATGGAATAANCASRINLILDAMRNHGLIQP